MNYKEMYEEAVDETNGYYKGYEKGNALSHYVYEKYGVNAASNNKANDALCDVYASRKEEIEDSLQEDKLTFG